MPENPAIDLARPCSEGQAGEKAYGCLFCITGKEENVVEQIQTVCPDVRATTMRQLKYRTSKKVKFFLRHLRRRSRLLTFQSKM